MAVVQYRCASPVLSLPIMTASSSPTVQRPVKGQSIRKLQRFLETRWHSGQVPVNADEIREAMGWTRAEWALRRSDALRWLDRLRWRRCSRKLPGTAAKTGFWPPLAPAPRIDEWSELD